MVTALVTCFNKEKTIKQALKSYIKCENIDRIIIYDDKSTDNSTRILKKYSKLKKLEVIYGTKNLGVSRARNLLINFCNDDIMVFFDADDVIDPIIKKKQIDEFIRNENLLFSYSDYTRVTLNKQIKVTSGKFSYSRLQNYNFIPFSSVIVRKKLFFKNIHHEDYYCWLVNLRSMSVQNIHYFNKNTFYYDGRHGGLSVNKFKGFLGTIDVKYRSEVPFYRILSGTIGYIFQAIYKRM